jgi:hypothetical protein
VDIFKVATALGIKALSFRYVLNYAFQGKEIGNSQETRNSIVKGIVRC